MGRFTVVATLMTVAFVISAEQVSTEWGEWQYLSNTTALETSEHLLLYGQTDAGVTWVLTRECHTGVPTLQSRVQHQGEAVDIDRVRFERVVRTSESGRTAVAEDAWWYDTRIRYEDRRAKIVWRYAWNRTDGWEILWIPERYGWREDDEGKRGSRALHSIDRALMADQLVIEISQSKGLVIFATSGFVGALAEHCGYQPWP